MEADLRLLGDVDQRAGVIADDHGVACGGVLEVVERDLNTRRFCSDSSAEARSMIIGGCIRPSRFLAPPPHSPKNAS